jgi:hypothetical protein
MTAKTEPQQQKQKTKTTSKAKSRAKTLYAPRYVHSRIAQRRVSIRRRAMRRDTG